MTPPTKQVRHLFALLHKANITDRDERLNLLAAIICKPVTSTNDLTEHDLQACIDTLTYFDRNNELQTQCHKLLAGNR